MKELRDLDCKNKKIIVRVDLNVPVLEGTITDHSRIHAILPTLEKLIKNKNRVFLIAHFGRPKGEVNKKNSIKFLCLELKKFLNLNTIHFLTSAIGTTNAIVCKPQVRNFDGSGVVTRINTSTYNGNVDWTGVGVSSFTVQEIAQ